MSTLIEENRTFNWQAVLVRGEDKSCEPAPQVK